MLCVCEHIRLELVPIRAGSQFDGPGLKEVWMLSPQGVLRLNWRELLFGEARFYSRELSYFLAAAAKKKVRAGFVDMHRFEHGLGMIGVTSTSTPARPESTFTLTAFGVRRW